MQEVRNVRDTVTHMKITTRTATCTITRSTDIATDTSMDIATDIVTDIVTVTNMDIVTDTNMDIVIIMIMIMSMATGKYTSMLTVMKIYFNMTVEMI